MGLDLRVAAGVVCQALEGLQFAHRFRQPGGGLIGVIHRDMSPSNVFVTSAGQIKVLDFGVAKVSRHAKTTVTGLKGKYPYMAPEQIRGQEVDSRSDLFSVGVVLFEAVTGEPLFHRANDFDTLQAIVNNERPRVGDFRPDVPLGVEEVIERALRPRREERFASAREMSEALTRALAPLGGPATTGELADIIRRDCAVELDDERSRIDRAAEYLKELAGRGLEPPDSDQRARPVVETEIDLRSHRKRTQPFDSSVTSLEGSRERFGFREEPRHRRRWLWFAGIALVTAIGVSVGLYAANRDGSNPAGTAVGEPDKTAPAIAATAPATSPAASDPDADASAHPAAAAKPPAPEAAPPPEEDSEPTADRPRGRRSPSEPRPRHATPSKPPAVAAAPGYFSIDTMPYSEVYIDGKLAGITPLVRVPLRPGKHTVRMVPQIGPSKRLTIQVHSGKTVSQRVRLQGD
jgi:serine/threonine-protein kinase